MEHVRWLAQPKLQRPTVIAAFTGWNDAGDAASVAAGGMQVLTLTNGDGSSTQFNESVYVLDNHSETLFVYTIENATDKRGLILRTAEPLQQVFRNARPRQ